MAYSTRLAGLADAADIVSVIESAFSDISADAVKLVLSDPRSVVMVAQKYGKIIGVCPLHSVDEALLSVCDYVVLPSERGKGVGSALWSETMARIPAHANVCLYGVEEMVHKYRSQGFIHDAYGVNCYTGQPKMSNALQEIMRQERRELKVVEYSEAILDQLIEYDKAVSSRDRRGFIRSYFNICGHIYVCLLEERVVGYAASRMVGDSYGIMPLYANDEHTAHLLVNKLLEYKPYDTVLCIYAVDNDEVISFWKLYGMSDSNLEYKCRLLSKKQMDFVLSEKVFSVASTEFDVV